MMLPQICTLMEQSLSNGRTNADIGYCSFGMHRFLVRLSTEDRYGLNANGRISVLGDCDYINQVITISGLLPAWTARCALLHEVGHAMVFASGLHQSCPDNGEVLASSFAVIIDSLMTSNL